MGTFFAILAAKLLDPISGVISLVVGYFVGRGVVGALVGGVVGAVSTEVLLSALQGARAFNPVIFLIGLVAYTIWGSVGSYLRSRRKAKESSQ